MAEWSFAGEGGGAPALDVGQPGGALHGASSAHATLSVAQGPAKVERFETTLPESHVVVTQIAGFAGQEIILEGLLRAATEVILEDIEADIDSYKTGFLRTRDDTVTLELERLSPTTLTLRSGLLRDNVELVDYIRKGPRRRGADWFLQECRIVFKVVA